MTEIFNYIGPITLIVLVMIGVEVIHRKAAATARGDDPLIDVLHRALNNRTGALRVSDAYLICGIEPGKVTQDQISRFGRAIRGLGWERQQRRFDGSLQYAYVRGTAAEREVALIVEYDPHMRSVRIEPDERRAEAAEAEAHRSSTETGAPDPHDQEDLGRR